MSGALGPAAAGADGVVRPSISPLLWVGAAAWIGALAGGGVSLLRWAGGSGWVLAGGCACLAAVGALAFRVRRTPVALPLAAIVLGLVTALLHGWWLGAATGAAEHAGPREWSGVVAADPRASAIGTSVVVRLTSGPAVGATAVLTWPDGEALPAYGRAVTFSSRLRAADSTQEWGRAAFLRGEAIRGRPWRVAVGDWAPPPLGWAARWRELVGQRLAAIGGPGAPILASMLLGEKGAVAGSPAEEDAKTAGVAWALGASGLHLAVVLLVAERGAGRLGLGRRGRAIATLSLLGLFVMATGMRLALVRAAIVAAVAVSARFVGRRRDATAAVGLAVLLLVALDPPAAFDIGLLLGVLALVGIVVFAGLVRTWLAPVAGRHVARGLAASTAAQLTVAPLSASLFGALAPLAPVTLAVSAPLVALAVGIGLVGALLAPVAGAVATPILRLATLAAWGASTVWRVAAGVSGAAVPVAAVPWWAWALWAACGVAAWLRWPRPKRAARVQIAGVALVVLLASCAVVPAHSGAQLVVMDIGQGDAILLRDGAHTLLVDTGPDPTVLRNALARQGVHSLDGLVLTHAHADHIGGLAGLAGVARPAWIGIPDVVDGAVAALARSCAGRCGKVLALRRDMCWSVGETRVRVLWPCGGERSLSANDTSVVLLLERGQERLLLLGDAEERAQRGVLEAFAGRVDVLKVAHHGSTNGNVPEALAVWRPPLALISVGVGNRFGHPHRAALDSLAEIGAEVHRTDREGDLSVGLDAATAQAAENSGAAEPAAQAARDAAAVCDNRPCRSGARDASAPNLIRTEPWLPATSPISSLSISSTAPRISFSSAPCVASGTAWPRSPTSTSTWTSSRRVRPPPTTSSTRPTRCRS